jgi:predicted RNase H-like HicB family nuclease
MTNLMTDKAVVPLRYELVVYWSQKDDSFIVEVPELPGCLADGPSYVKAVKNAEIIIREWIETATRLGRPVPEPKERRLMYA